MVLDTKRAANLNSQVLKRQASGSTLTLGRDHLRGGSPEAVISARYWMHRHRLRRQAPTHPLPLLFCRHRVPAASYEEQRLPEMNQRFIPQLLLAQGKTQVWVVKLYITFSAYCSSQLLLESLILCLRESVRQTPTTQRVPSHAGRTLCLVRAIV